MDPDLGAGGGLQNERTTLAWRRTALAGLVAGALVARHLGGVAGLAVLLGVAAGTGAVDLHAHRRYRHRSTWVHDRQVVSAPADVAALTALVLALAAVALFAVLLA